MDVPRLFRIDRVAAVGAVVALAAALMPFVTMRPNRLAQGQSHGLAAAGGWAWVLALLIVVGVVLAVVRVPVPEGAPFEPRGALLLALAGDLTIALAWAQGAAARRLLEGTPSAARVSVAGGGWLLLVAVAVFAVAGSARLKECGPDTPGRLRPLIGWLTVLGAGAAVLWGGLEATSLGRELAIRADVFSARAVEHLGLTGAGLGIGLLIGLPLGVAASRHRTVRRIALWTVSIIQTIPSLAVLGLLIAPLAALAAAYPFLADLGIRGIGTTPAVIALTLYALLPIVRNTYTGLVQVDPGVIDAGRGMGMTSRQLLWKVEMPLALPLVFEGVRLAAVLLVGITALTALNGAGGFGFFIFEGLNQAAPDLILLGSLPTIVLALILDHGLRWFGRVAVPEGARR